MSFPKEDRKVRSESGKGFPIDPVSEIRATLSIEIADALRREFGDGATQVKRIARLMGVNPRTVRNWLQSDNGPNGAGLVVLMRHSDEVTAAVLALAGRQAVTARIEETEQRRRLRILLRQLLDHLDATL
jgi:AcrR family transcriptional regulator